MVFKNSKRIYQSAYIETFDTETFKMILKQVDHVACMKFKCIEIGLRENYSKEVAEVIKRSLPNLEEICVAVQYITGYSRKLEPKTIRSLFDGYKLTFKVTVHASPDDSIKFDEINKTFEYPKDINFSPGSRKIIFENMVENVEKAAIPCSLNSNLMLKNLKLLDIKGTMDYFTFKNLIHLNRKTLNDLRLSNSFKLFWNFELPCQLKTFSCKLPHNRNLAMNVRVLKGQRNLRHVHFSSVKITTDLLETLSSNHSLSIFEVDSCSVDSSVDVSKFEILKTVSDIFYSDSGVLSDPTLVKAILSNGDNIIRMEFEGRHLKMSENLNLKIEDEETKKALNNLKVLKVKGEPIFKHIFEFIESPNLEYCSVNCYPSQLFGCKKINTLKIQAELTYEQVVEVLENFPSLKTFHFNIYYYSFEKTLRYILSNQRRIGHFKMALITRRPYKYDSDCENIYSDEREDELEDLDLDEVGDNIIEPILNEFGLTCERMFLTYHTENLSFEVCFSHLLL